mmetsp:Transcript_39838/g.35192  ORF Transcript_39838/g.35192 Transcript_39838/m.35192 type:complete len:355 (-) Transcript_39838:102-1166(-)
MTLNQILVDSTYFGIIAEYFHSIEYIQNLSLISRFHYNFPKDEQYNFQIITRMLSREFFDIKSITKLIGIESDNIYQSIYVLHHFYMNFDVDQLESNDKKTRQKLTEMVVTYWMKKSGFLSRWRYLTSYNSVKLYGIKYWLAKMKSLSHQNHRILASFNCETNNDLVTTMILHSAMNGDRNSFSIDSCTELMNFSINHNGDLPSIPELTRILYVTLDINQNYKSINHSMFAWSLNYLCLYFENRLFMNNEAIMNFEIVQELSALIAELILTLHTANIEHNIFEINTNATTNEEVNDKNNQEIDLFHDALNKYLIPERLKKIWSQVMTVSLTNFTAGFSESVSSFFNCLMDLCNE